MRVTTEMSYPGADLDAVVAMVFDKSFRAAVCEATKAVSHQVDISLGDGGSAVVTVRRTLPAEVPDFVKKFVGETIELVQSETWAVDDGSGVRRADLNLAGTQLEPQAVEQLLGVDHEAWRKEFAGIGEYLFHFHGRLPEPLRREHQRVSAMLGAAALPPGGRAASAS